MTHNPNVVILSGEKSIPLGRQRPAFAFPDDTVRCHECALPGATVSVADRAARIVANCLAHGAIVPRGWSKV